MTTRSLPNLASLLAVAGDVPQALSIIADEAAGIDRGLAVQLLLYDARRQVIAERVVRSGDGIAREPLAVAIDHFPPPSRKRIGAGDGFADFGNQSADYMKLLGIPAQEGAVLSLRGLHLDGELAGILVVVDVRRRFGTRLVERIAPACDLFALAFARLLEHEARVEAVAALETLTRSIHGEYEKTIGALEARIAAAYDARTAGQGPEAAKISQLEKAAQAAAAEARTMAERLSAVEEQVESAVARLEKAHVELHNQSETVRSQSALLYRIERMLDEAGAKSDPQSVIEELLSVVNSRG